MTKKRLPIGISDFKTMIENNYYYADKTLLIKELIDGGAAVTLIPRPRRFGKTLNLSMLKYFFEKTTTSNIDLFNNLAITQDTNSMAHQGQYPVIFLTFKDVKEATWDECLKKIKTIIANEFKRHDYLLNADIFKGLERNAYQQMCNATADTTIYANALFDLSTYLYRYHNKKVMILLDEYDMPIHAGFLNNYYDQIISFIRNFLSAGLKDNVNLERGVITGILRVARESIFSGLNNLRICSILTNSHADKFGLVEEDVQAILNHFNIEHKLDDIRSWYDGYTFGNKRIYNPWSIINFIDSERLIAHWVNTSDNALIKSIIAHSDNNDKEALEQLMAGGSITKQIDENIIFQDIEKTSRSLWNFFLFTGYLTFSNYHQKDLLWYADLSIPNNEILSLYRSIIIDWFDTNVDLKSYTHMLNALTTGQIESFKDYFYDIVEKSLSFIDVGDNQPEKFYHALVLGLLVSLNSTHMVKSNRESGLGRYDVMIIPHDKNKPGIIIEFKKVKKNETLEASSQNALQQIEEKKYAAELQQQGIKNIIKLAIVFEGKNSMVTSA